MTAIRQEILTKIFYVLSDGKTCKRRENGGLLPGLERMRLRRNEVFVVIKVVYCISKKAGLSDEEFFDYWQNVHGPIGARIPGLRKLVQSHRLQIAEDSHSADFDGVAELWFDSVGSLLAARETFEWKASSADEANFIDHKKVAYFVSEERVLLDKTH
jgi:uncharacterized protein (TIGR02118 family)